MPTGRNSTPIEAYLPLLMTKKQVAYLLSTSVWGVEELVRKGDLIMYTDGGKAVKFKASDVRRYVANLREKLPPGAEQNT